MKQLKETTMLTNPSIESILFYNYKQNEWFTTKFDEQYRSEELVSFLEEQEETPRLKPVLRKVISQQGNIEKTSYVFSYFMYQFSDPKTSKDSYIVVNQNANWFIDNIVNIKRTDGLTNSIYLLDQQGNVCDIGGGTSGTLTSSDAHQYLIQEYWNDNMTATKEQSEYHIQKYKNKSYLVTSIQLGNERNTLVMIQDFNDVFKDLIALRNNFIWLSCIFAVIISILLVLVSKRIYSPVNMLMNDVVGVFSQKGGAANSENEFDYLRNIYRNAREINQKLMNQSESYELIVGQHQIYRLISDSTKENFDKFKKAMPTHWLVLESEAQLSVLIFKIDHFHNNKFQFEESDTNLLLYAVQNIVEELLGKECKFATFYSNKDDLAMIISPTETGMGEDALLQLFERCQAYIQKYLDITISVAYSRSGQSALELTLLYKDAQQNLCYRYTYGANSILNPSKCFINNSNEHSCYLGELDEKLIKSIKKKDIEQVKLVFSDIKNNLYTFQYDNLVIYNMALTNKINVTFNEMHQSNEIPEAIQYSSLYKKSIESEFMDDFFCDLTQYIEAVFANLYHESEEDKDRLFISTIFDFIQKNYNDITLSSHIIGDFFGISNRQVMRKFKDYTGITLNEYIVGLRMRKAASLLQTTEFSISKIVEYIGIENETYFYRLFKKTYHCTPREFSEKNHQ